MAETQVLGWGTQNAPAQREISGAEALVLLAVDATFDGTAAAGDFVPAVQILSDANVEVGTFPLQDTVTAGDSVRVTFAPFLRGGGAGIQFDKFPQTGSWLDITTTGTDPNTGNGVDVNSTDAVAIQSNNSDVSLQAGALMTLDAQTGVDVTTRATVDIQADTHVIARPTHQIQLTPGTDLVVNAGGEIDLTAVTGIFITDSSDMIIQLRTAATAVTVTDHLNNPIFKVNENGDLQGLTGKALTFNL